MTPVPALQSDLSDLLNRVTPDNAACVILAAIKILSQEARTYSGGLLNALTQRSGDQRHARFTERDNHHSRKSTPCARSETVPVFNFAGGLSNISIAVQSAQCKISGLFRFPNPPPGI